MKTKGILVHGKYFCSQDCSSQDIEVKEKQEKTAAKAQRCMELALKMKLAADFESEEDDVVIDL